MGIGGIGEVDPERAFLAEYRTLRDESAQARQAQQMILQWSLGAFSLFFGLLLTANLPLAYFIIIFGFGLPVLAFAAGLTWFGELLRMERVGYYLRAREKLSWPSSYEAATEPEWSEEISNFPLVWENYLASGTRSRQSLGTEARNLLRPRPRKQVLSYFGALLIYIGAISISEALFCAKIWPHTVNGSFLASRVLAFAWGCAVVSVTTFWFLRLMKSILFWRSGTAANQIPQKR